MLFALMYVYIFYVRFEWPRIGIHVYIVTHSSYDFFLSAST